MEIVVALMGLTMAVIVAAYVAALFTARSRVIAAPEESLREKLQAERNTVLTALRDLDFDFQTGKLAEADYRVTREKYAARGVEILKELDALGDDGESPAAAEDEIEAAVQARRAAKVMPSALKEDDIEAAIRARRQSARGAPQSTLRAQCPKCGRPIDPSDRFCARCGAALTVEASR